jgi:hypothetical protein
MGGVDRLVKALFLLCYLSAETDLDSGSPTFSFLASSYHAKTICATASGKIFLKQSQVIVCFSLQSLQLSGTHKNCARIPSGAHLPGCIGRVGGNNPSVRCPKAAAI